MALKLHRGKWLKRKNNQLSLNNRQDNIRYINCLIGYIRQQT